MSKWHIATYDNTRHIEVNVLFEMPYDGLHKKYGEKPIFVIYGTSYPMYYQKLS